MITMRARRDHLAFLIGLNRRHRLALLGTGVLAILLLSFLLLHRAGDPPSTPTDAAGRPAEAVVRAPQPPSASAAPASGIVPEPAKASPAGKVMATTGADAAADRWRALTRFDFAALPIDQVPADDGNVSPIAAEGETPTGSSTDLLRQVEKALPRWAPGHVADPVQRVRNYLLLLGVADFAQSPLERFLPGAVLAHMLEEFPRDELAQLVCWVALHADEGDVSALNDPLLVGLGAANLDPDEVRMRTYYYGVKLTRRIVGW